MIKKITLFLCLTLTLGMAKSQNPGLLISEFLQNPAGTDSPFEYIEFLAVDNIDFSVTPYTVIVCNNGTATTDGWIEGLAITYAFEITSGTVSVGDVVYVGGTSMTPTGLQLRVIDTGVSGGDGGIGNANASGVLGNGGASSDGIAVFNLPISSITNSTVPVDAVFYGSGPDHGAAVVSAGADGYQLPNNDLYTGGKLQLSSFLAPDEDLTIATGVFDQGTNTFSVPRTFATGTATDGISAITFASATPPSISFTSTDVTYDESAGTITFQVEITTSNASASSIDLIVRNTSTAQDGTDFTLGATTITFPASSTGTQDATLTIQDDGIEESSEYIILSLENPTNCVAGGSGMYFIYITDNDRTIPAPTNELKFNLLTSYSNGAEGSNSAEIVAYDSSSFHLFIANSVANNLDIVDFSDPSTPVAITSINLDSVGNINSVAVYNGLVAVALQNLNPQLNGYISFFDANGNWLKRLDAGAMPDMCTFNADGTLLVVACEGEPSDDYLTDPEGTVAFIDITLPASTMTNANVTLANFNSLNGTEAALIAEGIRIFGPGANASMDFEPEYAAISEETGMVYVTLQENNAVAIFDINTKTLIDVVALGTIDHNVFGSGMDISNVTSGINIANFPVKGLFLPDAISTLNISGTTYLFTANEGDSRDFSGFSEETRIKDIVLDPVQFEDAAFTQSNYLAGRLLLTNTLGDDLNDGDFEELYSLGTRSFSIWDNNGNLVYDSGDLIELIIANDPNYQQLFNASNTAGAVSMKNRSDDKGPEVEGITTAEVEGNYFAFVSLERVGGVFIFNVNDPYNPQYVGYNNNRDAISNGPDRGAEGIIFISADASPNGNALILLANEISSTVTVYELNSCASLSGLIVATENDETAFCENDSLLFYADATATLSYQWLHDGSAISGATMDEYYASMAGYYQVDFSNTTESCQGTSDSIFVTSLSAPVPTIIVTDAVLSTQIFDTYQWYFESVAITGADQQEYTPDSDGMYEVYVTNTDGCTGSAQINVNFTQVEESENSTILLYPNPAHDLVNIQFGELTNASFVIRDARGAIVYSSDFINSNQIMINTSTMAEGIYFIHVTDGEKTSVLKLTVHH
ncbi:MAG: choice-of-anchor I family protein [Crocinitomicaceae bacterium]|nr:choice-of-anchor I family protein [Crocinitomicaceae bacterium]